jgi:hypothetical protein
MIGSSSTIITVELRNGPDRLSVSPGALGGTAGVSFAASGCTTRGTAPCGTDALTKSMFSATLVMIDP